MTYEEVLKHYEENLCKYCCKWKPELRNCDDCPMTTVKEALNKQMPKKVKSTVIEESIHINHCPCCGVRFIRYGMNYCGECGQAIDWWSE